ncbi:sensor histidine kinase [Sinomonas sp.]|uniref:sensor histidine kinase n=1 Tax=Sinomonas sp. TaxID=1914986 RepID=UPI002FE2B212
MGEQHGRPRRPGRVWGIRRWATAVAVAVVGAALVLGGVLLLVLLQHSLITTTESSARHRAQDVAYQIASQDVGEAAQTLAATASAGQYVQVIGPQGTVVAASEAAVKGAPLTAARPAPGTVTVQDVSSLASIGDPDAFLVVALGVQGQGGPYTVVVASTVQVQAATVSTVAWFLLGAGPLLLVLVGVAVWVLVGRPLRQVERIRSQVDRIDAAALDGRVEEPGTGDEIHRLAVTMNAMLARLQDSDRAQRAFVSDASHELRSPLATLSAGIEVAAADPSGHTWEEMKPVLGEEAARMGHLVEDLLTLARADDGGLRVRAGDVDLDDLVDAEVRRLRALTGLRIEAGPMEPVRVSGDAARLGQVLRNVLDNAARHARTSITVGLAQGPQGVSLTVDNDGDPVPAAERERIFERFVRLDESRSRESGGAGLGLAIAARITAAHGGTITAGDAPGGGCRFEIRLPAQPQGLSGPPGAGAAGRR